MIRELQDAILKLKKETGAVILAHSYQSPEILEIADVRGDSFLLSVAAQKLQTQTVLLCGVRFMADTVKILNPDKRVILPVPEASCPMADQIHPARVERFRESNPGIPVVAYINTTTQLKTVCDVCVTSSSAVKIVRAIDSDTILFIPDKNLGAWIAEQVPEKEILLWDGFCPIHAAVTAHDCVLAKHAYPQAKLAVHPECPPEVLVHADFIGSTSAILEYAEQTEDDVIVGTEKSIADWLSLHHMNRSFPLLSKRLICPNMRLTTLTDVYRALAGTGGEEIGMEEDLRLAAKRPIDEMIRLGS